MFTSDYNLWCKKCEEQKDLIEELLSIRGNEEEIKDRFYRHLEFGTAGLRGVIGAGINRMNIHTIRHATQGLADYLNADFKNPSVAIAYDSRNKSDIFAKEAASVLAANNIKVYIYKELMPTPCLSYAVREMKCDSGIVVTASHNPAKYNGYKVYGSDGCQMTSNAADKVLEAIQKIDIFTGVKLADYDKMVQEKKIEIMDDSVFEKYLQKVSMQSINKNAIKNSNLKVVYTPLNGTGNKPVRKILEMMELKDIIIVKEQEQPDGNFPTCPFPNPEIKEALNLGLKYCKENNADLLLATDPDADRVGIAVPNGDDFKLISGNEVGALLFEYICAERTKNNSMPQNPVAVKTIVSTDLVTKIANAYNVDLKNVLTGFKYIGEQIGILEHKGEDHRYIFGFEESYGYLAGSYVRDKDAIVSSMLICEMTAFYKQQGISLLDQLQNLYKKYGVFCHSQLSFTFEGASGMEKMAQIMEETRENSPKSIGGLSVIRFLDYKKSIEIDTKTGKTTEITLPKSDVLVFELEDHCSVILRPSGTEPKIKAYYTATANTVARAEEIEQKIIENFTKILGF